MKPKLIKLLTTLAKLVVSTLALILVFKKIDMPSLFDLLKHCNIFLLSLAVIFFIISKILSAYRLNYFFRSIKTHIPEQTNIKLYWLGMFYNLFLPGGIGGDGYKVYYLNKKLDTPVKKGVLAIIFDRVTGLMSLGLLCMIFATLIPGKNVPDLYILAIASIGIVVFYYIVYKWFNAFYNFLNTTNLLALGTQISQVISAFLILKALGNDHNMIGYLFVFLISSVVAVIPFTIGGIGAREVAFLYASKILALEISMSIALSLLFFIITAIVSLIGLVYVFRPDRINTSIKSL